MEKEFKQARQCGKTRMTTAKALGIPIKMGRVKVEIPEKEFNLSEKRKLLESIYKKKNPSRRALIETIFNLIREQDKEFIKIVESDLRKKRYPFTYDDVVEILHKRAGDKLI